MDETHRTQFDFAEDSPVFAVVTSVAAREGTHPNDLPPLGDVINPDALETILATSEQRFVGGSVTFSYCDYVVTVRSNGNITVDCDSEPTPEERHR